MQKRAAAHAARTTEEIQAIKDAWAKRIKETKRMEKNSRQYEQLKADPDYRDVAFNPENGGLKATHVRHNIDKNKGWYEEAVQKVGFNYGHSVILENEIHNIFGKKNFKGLFDGLPFEIAGVETGKPNNVRNALKHCASKPDCAIAVLFFPDKDRVLMESIRSSLKKYFGLRNQPDQFRDFEKNIYDDSGKNNIYPKKSRRLINQSPVERARVSIVIRNHAPQI